MVQVDELERCEHDWDLVELRKARKGLDKVHRCTLCGDEAVELASTEYRPPL